MTNKDSIKIGGVTFTVEMDERKIAPGEISLTPRCEMRLDENGVPYVVSLDSEEAIINMINGTQPNNHPGKVAEDWKKQAQDLSETHEVEITQPNNPE